MTKEQLIQKLTSRKFWVAIVGFITPLLIVFNVPDLTIEQVTTIIMSGASLIAYVIGEGLVDASRAGITPTETTKKEGE